MGLISGSRQELPEPSLYSHHLGQIWANDPDISRRRKTTCIVRAQWLAVDHLSGDREECSTVRLNMGAASFKALEQHGAVDDFAVKNKNKWQLLHICI